MLQRMHGMPEGTYGFEAVGDVDDDDWEKSVEPTLRDEIARGGKVRLLYLIGPRADVDGDVVGAEAGFRARHVTDYERLAVVSDEDWIRPALRALSVLLPGHARGFRVHDLERAKAWVAGASE